ncbi:MAG: SHOCT domain-containing protein, partial [Verrucomicrobiota bacterium]
NGRMPRQVNCPVCGAEGTDAANEIITRTLAERRGRAPSFSSNRPAAPGASPFATNASKAPVEKSKAASWISAGAGCVALAAAVAGFLWWKHHSPKSRGADRAVAASPSIPGEDGGRSQRVIFPPTDQPVPAGSVDTLDYILQEDDTDDSWTLFDSDVRVDRDPDGTATPTFILNKWMNSRAYEVYKVTAREIQLRYEAQAPETNVIRVRRFEGIGAQGEAPGVVCFQRIMTPGGPGFFSSFRQDQFVLDRKTGIGKVGKDGGFPSSKTYVSITWVTNKQGEKSLFEGNPVIRRIDEWHMQGAVFEAYDYAYRNGPVGWHWYERVSTLPPKEGDPTKQVFHCENGYVFVASKGSATKAPEVYQYDPQTKTKIKPLRVILFKSHQTPELGEQWYVIYRDTGDDYGSLQKKPGHAAHDFTIPEWKEKPGATIADIPCLYTHMPAQRNRPSSASADLSSPGKTLPATSASTPQLERAPAPASKTPPADRLKELKALFDQGLIPKEIYDQKRKEILDSL